MHSENVFKNSWVTIQDESNQWQIAFPHQPVQMQFELSETKTLKVYENPFQEGVLLLIDVSDPSMNEDVLEPQTFERLFYSDFIQRIFYEPKLFKAHHHYEHQFTTIQGHSALQFSFTYQEREKNRLIAGFALVKGHHLYIPLYLANKNQFDPSLLQYFIQSLKFH